ncbi:hypothetical protein HPCPY1662_1103 [Helicobacter pylori CPY1662]|nr:hypothetical protein HPCPY1662_1103 [Helicobacter pylori CPY1662]
MRLYQKLGTLHPIKSPMQFESAFYLSLKSGLYPNCESLFRSLYCLMALSIF